MTGITATAKTEAIRTARAIRQGDTAEWDFNPYEAHGYQARMDYLRGLAEDHDVSLAIVLNLAQLLGPREDFDGLVVALDDYCPE